MTQCRGKTSSDRRIHEKKTFLWYSSWALAMCQPDQFPPVCHPSQRRR